MSFSFFELLCGILAANFLPDLVTISINGLTVTRARGLDTCPQAAFNHFHDVIEGHLGLDKDKEMVVVSMALGYADPDALDNTLLTEREPVESFAKFWA